MRRDFALGSAFRATGDDAVPSAVHRLTSPGRPRAGEGGRWGLVLGGGGVLGVAWLIGALDAFERATGLDAREAELIVGTSAGSIVGALLAGGVSVQDQRDRQLGTRTGDDDDEIDRASAPARPPRPRLRPGSLQLIRNNRRTLREIPALALLAGLAPTGRARLDDVARIIERTVPAGRWPERFRAVTLDYETGRRVVLGDAAAPAASVADAVLASCAIPGWFEPVTIQGRRYVDGGAWSPTNADVLAGAGLDEVFVLAPMAATAYDSPTDWRLRAERRLRVRSTRRTLAEARRVRGQGATVTVITPGPEELTLWGYNFMHPGRRRVLLESATRTIEAALEEPGRLGTVPQVLDLQAGAEAPEREEAEPG